MRMIDRLFTPGRWLFAGGWMFSVIVMMTWMQWWRRRRGVRAFFARAECDR